MGTMTTPNASPSSPGLSLRPRISSTGIPDIIHCNDWQTSLVPIYMLEDRYRQPALSHAKACSPSTTSSTRAVMAGEVLEDLFGLDESYFNENMLQVL